ncbi:putative sodium-dependent multivitamin transporter [Macrosteles quadrilineatus]|uniref:putative sodium-dependent multivitamin transporter n=1 Tax=Macrosteles quadrilineatus TaxID=74068 RepID=UPI0023E2D9B8|nr:putative sodium-dependent multivitamin transporter [Macrosteles quadrilineatus]
MVPVQRTIGIWDYAVLCVTLLTSLSIGIYFRCSGGKQKTTQEYLLGDRNQSVLPVAVSLMASFMSAITLLGVTAEVYMFGTLFLTIIGSYVVFTAVAAYLYLPVFFKLGATSVYEYLEQRFGPRVRLAASLLYSLQMVLYMGVVLYAPAIALEALTGLSRNFSILLVGSVCTAYSTVGGIKAVIWTDVFQSGLMYLSLFSVVGVGIWKNGGIAPIFRIAEEHGRIEFFNLSPDPTVRHTTWTLAVGGGFTFLSLYAVNQTQIQRYLTMKDHKTAVRSLWISLPFLYILLIACGLAGLSIFSVYYACDPVSSGRIKSLDQLMPLFVMDMMGSVPGLSGLFAAGIFSASLSSVSPCVNSLAAVTMEDYLKPLYRLAPKTQLTHTTALTKCLVLAYGVACVTVAFLAQYLGGLLQAGLSILGIVGGPLLGTSTLTVAFLAQYLGGLLQAGLSILGIVAFLAQYLGGLLQAGLSILGIVAFLAQYLGGLLQAGLSILGIVGGPLLGTFTLGMFVPPANEPGALAGMLLGLTSSVWLGFGGPKPRPTPLPLSTAGCNVTTSVVLTDVLTTTVSSLVTPQPSDPVDYQYMFRLSYLLYVVISCLVTLLVGCLVSCLARACGHIPRPLDPDHFSPPVASYLRRKLRRQEMTLHQQMLEQNDVVKLPN